MSDAKKSVCHLPAISQFAVFKEMHKTKNDIKPSFNKIFCSDLIQIVAQYRRSEVVQSSLPKIEKRDKNNVRLRD